MTTPFGAPSSQSSPLFGSSSFASPFGFGSSQSSPLFGSSSFASSFGVGSSQSSPSFGSSSLASSFGVGSSQSSPSFGSSSLASSFGVGSGQSSPSFGSSSFASSFGVGSGQSSLPSFGNSSLASSFGVGSGQSSPSFGNSSFASSFGVSSSQSSPLFSIPPFASSPVSTPTPAFSAPTSSTKPVNIFSTESYSVTEPLFGSNSLTNNSSSSSIFPDVELFPDSFSLPLQTESVLEQGTEPQSNQETTQKDKDCIVEEKENNKSCQMGVSLPVEITQNKATIEANQEPVSNLHLQLTVVSGTLNRIPQNPHFLQLRSYSELTRKNLISAWDRTFEETVEQICSLQVVDFWDRARELWKTIEELQTLGYSVIQLRKRLVELTDVIMERKSYQMEIKGMKLKAENHRMEKSRLDSKILKLQAFAIKEQDSMERVLIEVESMENDLPKFDHVFAKLATEPL